MDQGTDVVAPTTRGAANTTWFGWEVFDLGTGTIDDTTPDIGTTTTGPRVRTLNGENHKLGNNIYSANFADSSKPFTLQEEVTVPVSVPVGTPATSGFTTIIAQFITASGNFPGSISMSQINGVLPTVVRGISSGGKGQVWAKWVIGGNAASYVFTINGLPATDHYSIDRLVVDTHWATNGNGLQPDDMRLTQPLNQYTDFVVPSRRGLANTTFFGWDTFTEQGTSAPINDSTPDIGTVPVGATANFSTTNGEVHVLGSGNLYVSSGTLSEQVTVPTVGTIDTGSTTIIAQAYTSFGGFPGPVNFGPIAGVEPTVVQTTNLNGQGQVWARWKVPGNKASYTFAVSGPAGVANYSFTKFIVDTSWSSSATGFLPDNVIGSNPVNNFVMDRIYDVVAPSSRGSANTTYYGWETFNSAGAAAVVDDTSPDIGNAPVGARFRTMDGQVKVAGSGNFFTPNATDTNGAPLDEEVTVVTNGTPGTDGTTTIIAQIASSTLLANIFANPITVGSINGVAPQVVVGPTYSGRAYLWAKWVIPGNQTTYTFTLTGALADLNQNPWAFERLVIDTAWKSTAVADTMTLATPAVAHVMNANASLVAPSIRGARNTTFFGWDNFNDISNRVDPTPINDSTPDVGTTTTLGANFQTSNGQDHMLSSGNLYFFDGTLAEQITVPTRGTVGAGGFTTIILQIGSASGFGAFADTITLGSINGVAPTVVQALNSTGTGQLWAVWKVPGNAASYTIPVSGPANQAHFSFDRVAVDTLFSTTGYAGDSMAAELPALLTASPLPVGGVGAAYSKQLEGEEGNAPYTFTVSAGALPDGVTLSSSGLLSGTPTTTAVSNFTVLLTDVNGLTGTKAFSLTVTTQPEITTASPLPAAGLAVAYSQQLAGTGGTTAYTWTVSAGALPAGLGLSTSGLLSGTPTAVEDATFTVQISDANSLVATKVFALSVTTLPVVTTAGPLPDGLVGAVYTSTTLTASGGTAPYAWSVSSGTLPAGLALSAAGELSGTPTATASGNFTVQVTDANNLTATKQFSILVIDLVITSSTPLPPAVKGQPYSATLTRTGGTGPFNWTIDSGALPAGLSLNAATGVISGTPTATANAVATFTVKVTDTSNSAATTKAFSISVTTTYLTPIVDALNFGTTTVGLQYDYLLTGQNYPASFTVSGLPAGLKYVAATKSITGRASVSGVFNVKVRATNKAGNSLYVTAPLVVKALPNGLVGNFTGVITRDATANDGLGGRLTLSVTSVGGFTAKVQYGKTTKQFLGGYLGATAPQINVQVGNALLTLTLNKDTGLVTGTHGSATVSGWRNVWDKVVNPPVHRMGYYSVAIDLDDEDDIGSATIPQGYGFATFQVDAAGNLTVSGKTSDGQTITSAGFVGPNGQIAVYTPLYSNLGSVLGQLSLSADEDGEFANNEVSGELTWKKLPTAANQPYPALFGPTDLKVSGKYLAADTKGEVLGLPETGLADLLFTDGGVAATATNPNVIGFTYTDENKVVLPAAGGANNKAKATLAINAKTGAVSGLINLLETAPATVARNKVAFQGQIVRLADASVKAVGYFILPQIPGSGQTLATSPKLSGSLVIEQPSSSSQN